MMCRLRGLNLAKTVHAGNGRPGQSEDITGGPGSNIVLQVPLCLSASAMLVLLASKRGQWWY
jgi:GTPase involved in cell partitioning and DNA repair